MEPELVRYKVILFGNENVGKTSLVDRFVNDKFEADYIATIGYNVYEKRIYFDENIVSLMIYDIGGQEKFTELRKVYAKGADAAFIVYDITDLDSFNDIYRWREDLFRFTGSEITFIILGNKGDLKSDRQVQKDEGQKISSKLGALMFLETSAKTGEGVEAAFTQLASRTLRSATH